MYKAAFFLKTISPIESPRPGQSPFQSVFPSRAFGLQVKRISIVPAHVYQRLPDPLGQSQIHKWRAPRP